MPLYDHLTGELLQHGTSTLCEASGLPSALDYNIRPVWPGATIVGAAFPLRCAPGDNLAIHLAVAQAEPATCWWSMATAISPATGARS